MSIWTFILIFFLLFPLLYTAFMHYRRYMNEKDICDIDEGLFFERFDGAVVEHYSEVKSEHYILKGQVDRGGKNNKLHFPRLKVLGNKKRVLYLSSFQKSADDIYAFYLQQFERKNYKIIYSVYEDEFEGKPSDWLSSLYLNTTKLISGMLFVFRGKMLCYISGYSENSSDKSRRYASVFAVNSGKRKGFCGILVQIIEKEPVDLS